MTFKVKLAACLSLVVWMFCGDQLVTETLQFSKIMNMGSEFVSVDRTDAVESGDDSFVRRGSD
jgi:hypothetical protein